MIPSSDCTTKLTSGDSWLQVDFHIDSLRGNSFVTNKFPATQIGIYEVSFTCFAMRTGGTDFWENGHQEIFYVQKIIITACT
jgi:hypothetical protein